MRSILRLTNLLGSTGLYLYSLTRLWSHAALSWVASYAGLMRPMVLAIWFSRTWGGSFLPGGFGFNGKTVDQPSPPWAIATVGWCVLISASVLFLQIAKP